jgi:polysaccharide biosynthesis/export protein
MKSIFNGIVFLFFIAFCTGCINTKKFTYFNDITNNSFDSSTTIPPITIQSGDILQVTISTIDKEVSALFNPITTINNTTLNTSNSIAQGYLVDKQGNIELPLIGKVYVKGKTTSEINETLKNELNRSIKNAFVSTRLLNFRISVLGDVAKPGSFSIPNERVSILDALSLAGDLNITAQRSDVLLIREIDGRKTYTSIDLNDTKILSSSYFYLVNNDVLYIKPGGNRVVSSTLGFQLLPTILGALSLITVIITTVVK